MWINMNKFQLIKLQKTSRKKKQTSNFEWLCRVQSAEHSSPSESEKTQHQNKWLNSSKLMVLRILAGEHYFWNSIRKYASASEKASNGITKKIDFWHMFRMHEVWSAILPTIIGFSLVFIFSFVRALSKTKKTNTRTHFISVFHDI